MVAIHFIKIFSIAALVTFLVSSVEPATECPISPKSLKINSNDKPKTYIVLLSNATDKLKHFNMMKGCYNTNVQHINNLKGIKAPTENLINDFSVDGMTGYSMLMQTSLAEKMKTLKEVNLVEQEMPFSIKYALPVLNISRRAVDNDPPVNLDRIDQEKRPLDGKFIFPDSAGKGVNIFVVDTGIRTTHNEFGGRAKSGGAFCDGCNNDDENGHGTQVASIAAGKTFGVARQANLVSIRVLDAKGSGSNVGVIKGLAAVLDQHNKSDNKKSVVNMSLGGAFSAAVNKAVKDLTDAGVHVAVAAGNDGEDACKSSPASEPSAITVGATEENDETITDFSNIGKCLDIFAPGRNIIGSGIKNDKDIKVFSGTSQATPHVAGTLALIIAQSGNKSPADMAKQLNELSSKGIVQDVGKTNSPDSFLRTPAP